MSKQAGVPVLVIRASNRRGALPLRDVLETMRPLPVARLAGTPPFVVGVAIVRGEPIPVVDLRVLLGGNDGVPSRRFVTVRLGGRPVALAVDEVLGVQELEETSFQELPPLLGDGVAQNVAAIGRGGRELLLLLQCSRGLLDGLEPALRARGARA